MAGHSIGSAKAKIRSGAQVKVAAPKPVTAKRGKPKIPRGA